MLTHRKSIKKVGRPYKRPSARPSPRPELHRLLFSSAAINMVTIPNTWRETDLCASISAGGAFYNRVGNKITVRSVRWRGVLAGGATGSGVDEYYNSLRVVMFVHQYPKPTGGSLITPLATAGVTGSQSFTRDYIPGLQRVLFDKMIGIQNNPFAANNCSPGLREFDFFHVFPGRGLEIQFSGNGTETDQTGIWVAAISDSGVVPNPGMIIGNAELAWYDV